MSSCLPSGETIERVMQKESLDKKTERQILVFTSASEELGLDISCVRGALRPQKTYPLPKPAILLSGR